MPDEVILHAISFMPDATVLSFCQCCKRLSSLRHTDTVWLPRLWQEFGLRLRVRANAAWVELAKPPPSSLECPAPEHC